MLSRPYTIQTEPAFISAADDSFTVRVHVYNLGKAIKDSVRFVLLRYKNNSDSTVVYSAKLPYIKALDTLIIKLPIVPNQDTGVTKYAAYIDNNHQIPELSEDNNLAYFKVNISTDELRPVYPANYAIVSQNKISFAASTAFALDGSKTTCWKLTVQASSIHQENFIQALYQKVG
jgi:hypothetical protein